MANKSKKYPHAFYERGSWYHRTKALQEDYSIKYGKAGGFKSAAEAEEAYEKHIDDFNQKMDRNFIGRNKNTTFKNYLIYWYASLFSERVQTTTLYLAAYVVYGFLLPNIDDKIILRFVSTDYLNRLLEKVSKYSDSSGNKSREMLYIAMKDAVSQRLIDNNPVKATQRYPRKKTKVQILKKNQIRMLLQAERGRNWFLEVMLALYCGLRKGEILGLKFSDFDLEKQTVTIRRQLVTEVEIQEGSFRIEEYKLIFRDPKSKASKRTLKVPPIVLIELERRREYISFLKKKNRITFEDNDLISCQENGKRRGLSSLNNELIKVCKRISLPHITVHGLRHMYATILMEKGVSLAKISALLGHTSINTTFDFYIEIMEDGHSIVNFLNEQFELDTGGDADGPE